MSGFAFLTLQPVPSLLLGGWEELRGAALGAGPSAWRVQSRSAGGLRDKYNG